MLFLYTAIKLHRLKVAECVRLWKLIGCEFVIAMEFAERFRCIACVCEFKFSILGFVEIMFAGARGSRCRSFSYIARCACFSVFKTACAM